MPTVFAVDDDTLVKHVAATHALVVCSKHVIFEIDGVEIGLLALIVWRAGLAALSCRVIYEISFSHQCFEIGDGFGATVCFDCSIDDFACLVN